MSEQMDIVEGHLENAIHSLSEAEGNWASPRMEVPISCIKAAIRTLQVSLAEIEKLDSTGESKK